MTLFQRSQAGHVAPTAGDELDLHVTSTPLSLGIIQGFTTAVSDVTGQLVVDVRLTGAGEDPHVEGIVDIQGGGFAVPLTGVSYSGLSHEHRAVAGSDHDPEPADRRRGGGAADDQRLSRRARAASRGRRRDGAVERLRAAR